MTKLTMSGPVGGANGECPIQHTSAKDETIARPAGLIVPFAPDEFTAGIAFPCCRWHDRADHDGHKPNADTKTCTQICNPGQDALAEEDNGAGNPCDT